MRKAGISVAKGNNEALLQKIFEWWQSLQAGKPKDAWKQKEQNSPDKGSLDFKSGAGDRANLRRARNPDMVAVQQSYLNLYRIIMQEDISDYVKRKLCDRLPLVAGVLSHVVENSSDSVAVAMGSNPKTGSDRPRVSDLRFRRLMRTKDEESLYIMMIRMVRMMDGRVNVKNLAESLFFWDDMTRKRWASQYYLRKDIYS